MSSILGRMFGNEFRENLRKTVDELTELTNRMLEVDKELVAALKEHAKATRELRLTLKELKDKL
jgi:hypothetical protein